ncbi:hypothetical protein Tcan_02901 [Toxocara canis]|uniref:Uncharacterized protein n=1 Tax=Toxocara canis TaxID=6265 RepID=A0A0B2VCP6_TOXCA|nr:hypothetical protein Tcan_02901 [Toxocara canis]
MWLECELTAKTKIDEKSRNAMNEGKHGIQLMRTHTHFMTYTILQWLCIRLPQLTPCTIHSSHLGYIKLHTHNYPSSLYNPTKNPIQSRRPYSADYRSPSQQNKPQNDQQMAFQIVVATTYHTNNPTPPGWRLWKCM